MSRINFVIFSFLFLQCFQSSLCLLTEIKLFSTDMYFAVVSNQDIPNLGESVYPNLTWTDGQSHRVCASGTWMIYYGENYTETGVDFIYAHNRTSCTNFWPYKPTWSLRRAGLDNSLDSAVTLFTGTAYTGEKHIFTEDVPEIKVNFTSIVVTGDEDYSFYPLENYVGCPFCIRRAFVRDTNAYARPPGSLKSMRKGCNCDPLECFYCSEA